MRDYQIASPSLEGVLNHDSILYEGIKRPIEILRILDGPASKGRDSEARKKEKAERGGTMPLHSENVGSLSEKDLAILREYFFDLYVVFMKKLSHFLVDNDMSSDDTVKLQAMLQEMIKVKKWVGGDMQKWK